LIKTITFLTGLYFPIKRHSNYINLSIDTIADIGVNPHWMKDSHIQYPQKFNVWAGIQLYYFLENVNTERYLHLLQNQVLPAIKNVVSLLITFGSNATVHHLTLA